MNGELSAEALELGEITQRSLATLGGVDVLRRAVENPAGRAEVIHTALDGLGVWDLRPANDQTELEAAAAVCRAAGFSAVPYPVAETLAGNGGPAVLLLPRAGVDAYAAHVDLPLEWTGVRLDGSAAAVRPVGAELGGRLGAFVGRLEVGVALDPAPAAASMATTLQSWWLLGLLERVFSETRVYTAERQQFGHVLQDFQTVGFRLAEMLVAINGLQELSKYTLWSQARQGDPVVRLVDAVALRVAALETADNVLRGGHQLHGAMGFCDETNLSWLSRASQAVRRLPEGQSQAVLALTAFTSTLGFAGPFAVETDAA